MAREGIYTSTFMFDGKRKYAYGKTPEEAKANAIRKKTLLEANVKEYKNNISVSDWAKSWLKNYKEGTTSNKWYRQMEAIIDNQIEPSIGDMRIKDVKPMNIKRLMNQYADTSESFQKKLLLVLRQIFDSAEENDVIDKVPTKRIKIDTVADKSCTRPITDKERELTLATAEKYPSDGLFFLIMLYCGCRPQEVMRLKMSDYDKEAKILHVKRAKKSDGETGNTKSSSGVRDIPVVDYLAERLDKLDKKDDDYIVTALNGNPLTDSSYSCLWKRFKKNMDIANGAKLFRNAIVESTLAEDLHPYCYRHTYCTDLQDAEVPLTVAKVLMGHSSVSLTANIYTHRTDFSIEEARKKMNSHVVQSVVQEPQTVEK